MLIPERRDKKNRNLSRRFASALTLAIFAEKSGKIPRSDPSERGIKIVKDLLNTVVLTGSLEFF